jgi:hypothetical protein
MEWTSVAEHRWVVPSATFVSGVDRNSMTESTSEQEKSRIRNRLAELEAERLSLENRLAELARAPAPAAGCQQRD